MEPEAIAGIPVVKETRYSAFQASVDEGELGPHRGCWLSFTEPTGHRHSFFCVGQTVASIRLQMAAAGFSGIETVSDIQSQKEGKAIGSRDSFTNLLDEFINLTKEIIHDGKPIQPAAIYYLSTMTSHYKITSFDAVRGKVLTVVVEASNANAAVAKFYNRRRMKEDIYFFPSCITVEEWNGERELMKRINRPRKRMR